MISVTLNTLSKILLGKKVGANIVFKHVSTDSRKITHGCLFVAIKGKNFDGHNFADKAKEKGASGLLVNRKLNINLPQIIVRDTRLAFRKLAAWVCQQFSTQLIALTGSTGKTSVKEMTAAILKQCGNTLYTDGNLNNDIGVSITLLRLKKEHDYAVIELGANHPGEIAQTVNLIHPKVALVNNFSASHITGFGSIEGVARAKGEIYAGLSKNGIAIINADNHDWRNWRHIIGSRKTWYFSLNAINKEFGATNVYINTYKTEFTLHTPIGKVNITLPLPGRHNIANALAASALSTAVGASLKDIKNGLRNFKAIPRRLFPIFLSENKLLLDDSYNANVSSMIAAIEVLSKMPGYRVMVVGDMNELGNNSEMFHAEIGKLIKESNLDLILSFGDLGRIISKESGKGETFLNKETLIERLKKLITKKNTITILVKGSRCSAMEEVTEALRGDKIC